MKLPHFILSLLLLCVQTAMGQQINISDEQTLKAAEAAFNAGNWNPKIFELRPIRKESATLAEAFPGSIYEDVRKELLKEFGDGPFRLVTYTRRPSTIQTNGGETYCMLRFLVFSPSKVATIDSRAANRPEDKMTQKSNGAGKMQ